jgi:hypothetical protein
MLLRLLKEGRLPWGIDSWREIQAEAPEVEIEGGPTCLERVRWKTKKGINRVGALLHAKGVSLINGLQSVHCAPPPPKLSLTPPGIYF